jgi:PQQ-dependent dehydrogenase (methanol/ethanol family)
MARVRTGLLGGVALAATLLVASHGIGRADSALDQAVSNPNNWAMYGHDYTNDRYSPLKQINDQNVSKLKLDWALQLGSLIEAEATPIVIGDTLYISSSQGPKFVYAADAKTGVLKWQFQPVIAKDVAPEACCGVVSRGVAYADGKILFGTLDGYLYALDAKTGKQVWKTEVVNYKDGSVITSPPLIVKNLAIIGFGGAEYGARGALQAYDVATGKQVWKTWTVPCAGEKWADTWKGDSCKYGGSTTWNVGAYDPKTNTVFWGTGNPWPWDAEARSTGTSECGQYTNAPSAATIGLDPDNGKIKWQIQGTPCDAWDYDGIVAVALADLKIDGKMTPVYLKDARNGFFFVANRDTGKLLSAKIFAPIDWAKGFDVANDRAIENPEKRPTRTHQTDVCPAAMGSTNWQTMAFNPDTGLAYFPMSNMCMHIKSEVVKDWKPGRLVLGASISFYPGKGPLGQFIAWNPVTQEPAWKIDLPLPWNGGATTTAGNLVFFGDVQGIFHAYDAKTGKELWHINLGSGISAGAATYMVDGKQYLAILAGRPTQMPSYMGEVGKKIIDGTPEGATLFVFSL